MREMIDRGEASPDREYAGIYGMLAQVLSADPEDGDFAIHRGMTTLAPGDTLVLCSDGIHDEIGEAGLWALFDPLLDVAAQAKVWRDAVWTHGATDNLALVVVRVEPKPVGPAD